MPINASIFFGIYASVCNCKRKNRKLKLLKLFIMLHKDPHALRQAYN